MNSFKSKKTKVFVSCLAVILIASILCVTLAACKNESVPPTPIDVFFVGDFQSNVSDEQLQKITANGKEIISVQEMMEQTGYSLEADKNQLAAAIYALAVTNYSNITQSGYYIMTDAAVEARGTSLGTANVGIRSTYSSITGKNGSFSQTVSGVTRLDGLGDMVGKLKSNFGYNIQSFSNSKFSINRRGSNGGAKFGTVANTETFKNIMGAYNKSLSDKNKGLTVNAADKATEEEHPIPEYVQTATKYPANTTLEGKDLPSFNANRKAWDPLNRIPARFYDTKKKEIVENYTEDGGTRYSYGNYGSGWAVYDLSRPEYLASGTKVSYDETLDLWTIEVAIKNEFVAQACEFATGDLIRDTKDYISLRNAEFTEISCKLEVYSNGLVKSMQKRDGLSTDEPSPLTVAGGVLGTCKKGGATSNTATLAFSYSDADCDALRYAALYWPQLGTEAFFKTNKDQTKKARTDLVLDLSSYPTMADYQPTANADLLAAFTDIFAVKK